MNDDEFAEQPSGFMLGKEFIIVLVIVFSGLSFTLGYFVGKNGTPKTDPVLQAIESPSQAKKQELPPVSPPPITAPAPEQAQTVLPPVKEPVAPAAAKPAQQLATKETASVEAKKSSEQKNPVSAQPKNAGHQIGKPAAERSSKNTEPAPAEETKSAAYTVQLGAFKNITEAKHLKAKFDKKGYKSVITSGKNKKSEKIFKVTTGEFKGKKEAEVLALKLKKTESLQTYVTLRTE